MKTKILLAAVAGALVLPAPMASQADVMSGMDFKISGRVAAGITRADGDVAGESATWDLGTTTDGDINHANGKESGARSDSRITFSADRETDIGTAGFRLERDWTLQGLTDNRHQYVYFGGDWGTLYVGNHGTPVGMGNGYDQSFFFGGGGRINGGDRRDGIGYAYSNGQFSLGVTLHGEGGDATTTPLTRIADTDPVMDGNQEESDDAFIARLTATGVPGSGGDDVPRASLNQGGTEYVFETPQQRAGRLATANANAAAANKRVADETIDTTIIGASYDLGIGVKIGAAYWKDNTETGRDSTSLMVSGAFNQFSYWVMFESASDARPNIAGNLKNDVDGYGVHLQYALSDADNVWFQYGAQDFDRAATADTTNTVLGYSHSFGGGATGVIEYYTNDVDDSAGVTRPDPSGLHIGVRVAF